MSIAEMVAKKVGDLPPSQQMEVLDFVDFLARKETSQVPRHDPKGILSAEPFDLTLEDFRQARKEMWKNFPREFPE